MSRDAYKDSLRQILHNYTSPSSEYAIAHQTGPVSHVVITPAPVEPSKMNDFARAAWDNETMKLYVKDTIDVVREVQADLPEDSQHMFEVIDLYSATIDAMGTDVFDKVEIERESYRTEGQKCPEELMSCGCTTYRSHALSTCPG
jgi:hypothetical protein